MSTIRALFSVQCRMSMITETGPRICTEKGTRFVAHWEGPREEQTLRGSVSTEAARWNDCLEFSEVEVADCLQCLGAGAVL